MSRHGIRLAALACVALLGAACGGGSEAGSGGDPTVTIEAPADGDEVTTPFRIELSSGVDLGPPESGKHHVHIFYDGDDGDYEVVDGTIFMVRELSASEHTIHASLRNADHSEAGAEDSVSVTVVGGGGGGTEGEGEEEGEDDPYKY